MQVTRCITGFRSSATRAARVLEGEPAGVGVLVLIAWLERAYAQRHPVLRFVGGPAFALLETDPRYRELRRRIGLPL